jgi:hypothetical protein
LPLPAGSPRCRGLVLRRAHAFASCDQVSLRWSTHRRG